MPGLSLGVGGYGSAMTAASVPSAANQPTGTTINQAAFGIGTSQTDNAGPRTAGYGTVGLGLGCAVVLTWIWWTLPR